MHNKSAIILLYKIHKGLSFQVRLTPLGSIIARQELINTGPPKIRMFAGGRKEKFVNGPHPPDYVTDSLYYTCTQAFR